jgi:hypothetical protein
MGGRARRAGSGEASGRYRHRFMGAAFMLGSLVAGAVWHRLLGQANAFKSFC